MAKTTRAKRPQFGSSKTLFLKGQQKVAAKGYRIIKTPRCWKGIHFYSLGISLQPRDFEKNLQSIPLIIFRTIFHQSETNTDFLSNLNHSQRFGRVSWVCFLPKGHVISESVSFLSAFWDTKREDPSDIPSGNLTFCWVENGLWIENRWTSFGLSLHWRVGGSLNSNYRLSTSAVDISWCILKLTILH